MAVPTLTANSPSSGFIAWSGFTIQYNGVAYSVTAGNTNAIYTAWLYNGGSPLLVTNNVAPINSITDGTSTDWSGATPKLGPDDLLLFVNRSGVPINVQASSMLDGDLIVTGTVTSSQIATNTIVATNIAANAITTAAIASGAVTASQIASNTITAGQIAANTITAAQIAASTITATQIAAATITALQMAALSISADKLTIGSLGSTLIANGGFEDRTGSAANTWTPAWAAADSTGVTQSATSSNVNGGGNAYVINVPATSGAAGSVASQSIPIVPGYRYEVSGFIKVNTTAPTAAITVYWGSTSGFAVGAAISNQVIYNAAPTTSYAKYVGQVVAPSNAEYMIVSLSATSVGTARSIYFDDFTVRVMAQSIVTSASGKRIEMSSTNYDRIVFYTGDANEATGLTSGPGAISVAVAQQVISGPSSPELTLISPNFDYTGGGGGHNTAPYVSLWGSDVTGASDNKVTIYAPTPAGTGLGKIDMSSPDFIYMSNFQINHDPPTSTQPNPYISASTVGMHYGAAAASSFHYFESLGGGGFYCPVRGGAYTNASSEHLKKNIKPITTKSYDPVETLHKIKPVHYQLKEKTLKDDHLGFIAEELQEVIPHAVWPAGEDEGDKGSLGVDVLPVVAFLTHALQNLEKRVAKVEAK